jgi:small subunit ribosomal protein S1
MTTPETPQDPTPNPQAGAPAPADRTENEGARASGEAAAAATPAGPITTEGSPAAADPGVEAADGGDDSGDGDDAADAGAATEAGGAQAATPGAPGTGKKRRRRKKKKPSGDAAHAAQADGGAPGAEGTPAEGSQGGEQGAQGEGAAAKDGKDKKKRKPKPEKGPRGEPRERPAFNVGDIVFGKIVEISDDAVFVDLSGKGRAIFDRHELELPDDVNAIGPDLPGLDGAVDGALGEAGGDGGEGAAGVATTDADDVTPAEAASVTSVEAVAPPSPAEQAQIEKAMAEAGHTPGAATETSGRAADAATTVASDTDPSGPGDARFDDEDRAAQEAAAAAANVEAEAAANADANAGEGTSAEAADGAGPEGEKAPEPPAQLPPVQLELGAHFVGIVHNDGGRGGLVVLTRHPKRVQRAKQVVAGAFKEKGAILGLVTGVIKGGIEVDVDGLRAFAPGSHVDLRLGADLSPLVGKRLPFYVTQYAKRGRDVVLSRRVLLEAEAKLNREAALAKIQVGSVVEGVVRSVVPFGAFVDVGGVEGLVPLQEMSHNRSDQPSDVFKAGEKTTVKITKVDDKGKVWLSRKATIADPWQAAAQKYSVGSRHTGKVVRLQPFGAFVELESGVDGLIHTADLSVKRIEHPEEVVKVGDSIEIVVASVDAGAHRIALHPAPSGDQANEAPQRVQLHKPVKVTVVAVESSGLVVRVLGVTGRNARGFITAAGTARGTELKKAFPVGTILDAKVIEHDPKRGELKLSIKSLQDETERSAYQQYRQQVSREAKFTFADLIARKQQQR